MWRPLLILGAVAGCASKDDGAAAAADAGSDVDAAGAFCASIGGTCQAQQVENLTCAGLPASYYEDVGGCGSRVSCCVPTDASGKLPSAFGGSGTCGSRLCGHGAICHRGTDTETCDGTDGGAACGNVTCSPGCDCLDAANSHCRC